MTVADANDDVVQDRFGARPGYAAEYAAERDLFYQSAGAADDRAARDGLAAAADRMAQRRARWFTGGDALYAEADDVFLTLEGTGNWAAWTWLTDARGGGMTAGRRHRLHSRGRTAVEPGRGPGDDAGDRPADARLAEAGLRRGRGHGRRPDGAGVGAALTPAAGF